MRFIRTIIIVILASLCLFPFILLFFPTVAFYAVYGLQNSTSAIMHRASAHETIKATGSAMLCLGLPIASLVFNCPSAPPLVNADRNLSCYDVLSNQRLFVDRLAHTTLLWGVLEGLIPLARTATLAHDEGGLDALYPDLPANSEDMRGLRSLASRANSLSTTMESIMSHMLVGVARIAYFQSTLLEGLTLMRYSPWASKTVDKLPRSNMELIVHLGIDAMSDSASRIYREVQRAIVEASQLQAELDDLLRRSQDRRVCTAPSPTCVFLAHVYRCSTAVTEIISFLESVHEIVTDGFEERATDELDATEFLRILLKKNIDALWKRVLLLYWAWGVVQHPPQEVFTPSYLFSGESHTIKPETE
ncbi:hypothetical protein GY45DRAFT_1376391 [Cubamyces sp. BRFM 1775]|nr:hypothetical protein GY45DRAFT_1376391 [Cubamyces sp. BRFM 1775]